jgi:polyisoprenoid-binding protein YceI
MNKQFRLIVVCISIGCLGLNNPVASQSIYKINESKDIDIKLSGTSTLHNWAMEARAFDGDAQFGFSPGNDRQLTSLTSLTFSLDVRNLKSDEKALDKNAYKALKTDRYKDILFTMTSASVFPEQESKYLIKTHGNLSIAGVTREIEMDVYCVVNTDESIRCTGSDKLNMTDYQVKPPSFLLGAMKTGDAITLDFTLVFKK